MWLSKSRIERNLVYFLRFQSVCVDFLYEHLLDAYYMHREDSCSGQVLCFFGGARHLNLPFMFLGTLLLCKPGREVGPTCIYRS